MSEQLTTEPPTEPTEDWVADDNDLVAARRTRLSLFSRVLIGAFLAALGFLGGVLAQKDHDKTLVAASGVTGTTATTARARTTTGAAAAAPANGLANGAVGQVKLVDGNTIYLTDFSGNTITVTTSGSSTFTKQQSASLHDVQPGDTVVVRGASQPDGSVVATQ
ncbi:MAG TPA: DUF5666 domain-containing protein, partial [Acidimicrobiales bacterium]|nr:DUF5666 domain-containing protein [Acidimicrobiales bacterium]